MTTCELHCQMECGSIGFYSFQYLASLPMPLNRFIWLMIIDMVETPDLTLSISFVVLPQFIYITVQVITVLLWCPGRSSYGLLMVP